MNGFEIVVEVRPWAGSQQVPPDQSLILYVSDIRYQGRNIPCSGAAVLLSRNEFMTATLCDVDPKFFESLSPDDYLEGSTAEDLRVPVAALIVSELQEFGRGRV